MWEVKILASEAGSKNLSVQTLTTKTKKEALNLISSIKKLSIQRFGRTYIIFKDSSKK